MSYAGKFFLSRADTTFSFCDKNVGVFIQGNGGFMRCTVERKSLSSLVKLAVHAVPTERCSALLFYHA
ncbi:hypothetical protein ALCH109712_10985 [Alkalicoccus chagannorensis]